MFTVAPLVATLAGLAARIPFHTAPLGTGGWQTNPALGARLAADRAGATLTGQPMSLAKALVKLNPADIAIPTTDLRTLTTHEPLFIRPASRCGIGRHSPLSTHPNLTTCLDQLANLTTARNTPGDSGSNPQRPDQNSQ